MCRFNARSRWLKRCTCYFEACSSSGYASFRTTNWQRLLRHQQVCYFVQAKWILASDRFKIKATIFPLVGQSFFPGNLFSLKIYQRWCIGDFREWARLEYFELVRYEQLAWAIEPFDAFRGCSVLQPSLTFISVHELVRKIPTLLLFVSTAGECFFVADSMACEKSEFSVNCSYKSDIWICSFESEKCISTINLLLTPLRIFLSSKYPFSGIYSTDGVSQVFYHFTQFGLDSWSLTMATSHLSRPGHTSDHHRLLMQPSSTVRCQKANPHGADIRVTDPGAFGDIGFTGVGLLAPHGARRLHSAPVVQGCGMWTG